MVLKFLDRYGNYSSLGSFQEKEDVFKKMHEYVEGIKFKSYYTRINYLGKDKIEVDFGSHSEFFYVEAENEDEDLIDIFAIKKEDYAKKES